MFADPRDGRQQYRPVTSQVSPSPPGSVQNSWQTGGSTPSSQYYFDTSRPSSVSFPSTNNAYYGSSSVSIQSRQRSSATPMADRGQRLGAGQSDSQRQEQWQSRQNTSGSLRSQDGRVLVQSRQQSMTFDARPPSSWQQGQAISPGSDLGPQVSRSTRGVASSPLQQPQVMPAGLQSRSGLDAENSVAPWNAGSGSGVSAVSPAVQRANSMVQSPSSGPSNMMRQPLASLSRGPGGNMVASGSLRVQYGGEEDDLPTLKQLVQVGTTGAMSSTAAVRPASMQQPMLSPGGGAAQFAGAANPQAQFQQMQQMMANYQMPNENAESTFKKTSTDPNQLIVALDVDEVLCQYVDGFRMFLQRERPNGPLDTDSIFHEAHSPNSPWRLQFALSGGLENLEAVPGAAAGLRRLRKAGIALEAVTSRPPIMRESTELLLNKIFPPDTFQAAHFVGPGEKGATCRAIGARAIVDDQVPNCIDCCQCGVISVLFDFCGSYPWSKNVGELPARCKRIETWAETCNFLLLALGVDPLEHSTQASEYLLGMKKEITVGRENIADEYADALSEAGKQPTEYDLDLAAASAPGARGPAPEEAQRSEPLFRSSPLEKQQQQQFSAQAAFAGGGANGQSQPGMMDPAQQDELRQKLLQQQKLQQLQQQQQILQQQQQLQQQLAHEQQILQMSGKMDSTASRDPPHAWNSEKGQVNGRDSFLNAGRFNAEQPHNPYRQQGGQGSGVSSPGRSRAANGAPSPNLGDLQRRPGDNRNEDTGCTVS